MILDFVYTEPPCGEQDTRPFIVKDVRKFLKIFICLGINRFDYQVSLFIFCHMRLLHYIGVCDHDQSLYRKNREL